MDAFLFRFGVWLLWLVRVEIKWKERGACRVRALVDVGGVDMEGQR